MNNLKFVKLIIIVAVIVIYSVVYIMTSNDKKTDLNNAFLIELNDLKKNYNVSKNYINITSNNIYDITINQQNLLKLFYQAKHTSSKDELARIRKKIYKLVRPNFNYLKKLGVVTILFSFENNKTFLRVHKPNKFGDDLSSVRYSITYVNSKKEIVRGFEKGKITPAMRNVFPLFYNGEYLGSVDISFSCISLQENMVNLSNSNTHLLLNKKIFKDNIWKLEDKIKYVQSVENKDFLFSKVGIEENIFSSDIIEVNKKLKDDIDKNMKSSKAFSLLYHDVEKTYIVSYLPIKNIKNDTTVAYIVSYVNNPYIHSIMYKYVIINILALLTLIIIAIISYYNIKHHFSLKEEVKKKTKQLLVKKNELEELVKAFDKNIIFSKTDLKGNIVHVSDAFCKISGYEANELIGVSHNVIRHPDMPKEVFKNMWETLKLGKTWFGEVKNRKKNGGYYWVFTKAEPDINIDGKQIGYYAVRQDITAQKEVEELKKNLEQQVRDRVSEIVSLDKEIQDTQREVVFTMGSIAESRSKETGNHVKRVAEYSKLLAIHYGLPEDEAEMLKQASPMHDIGKVAIPDAILNKPGRFDKLEREIMNTHSQLGYDMLKYSDRPLLKMASIVAYEHHEKWDGTGYPNSLKGKDIHIYGRITAIADVFDALGSDRVYKKAWELDRILNLFKEERGKQFDPQLIDIFFENIDEFLEIRDNFIDE